MSFTTRQTTASHRARLERMLRAMHAKAKPFADVSPQARAQRRSQPFFDWCATYLPHYFTAPPWLRHLEAEAASREEGMPQFHCWSRGAGKSTIFSLAKPLHWILEAAHDMPVPARQAGAEPRSQGRHFIIFGGATEDVAIDKSDFVKLELLENPRIRSDYGDDACQVAGPAGARVMGDTLLWCRGIGQSTRGQRHRQWRPDAFVGDDLENDTLVRNPKREDELWDWLLGATFPGLESHGARALFLVVGTMYGRHCMMARARDQARLRDANGRPLCRYFHYPLRNPDGRSAWPERYADADLERACAVMGARIARREIDCKEDDEAAPFRPEWIRDFDAADADRAKLTVAAYLDPSATANESSDYKALVVLATPAPNPKPLTQKPQPIFCLHAWIRHASPGEMVEHLFWVDEAFQPAVIGCESNGFQTFIWELLDIEAQRIGRRLDVKPINNRQNKHDRILANQGEFERGLCCFDPQEGDQRVLIDQFLDFGKPAVHDDGPDAWDGARRLLPARAGARAFFYRGLPRSSPFARRSVARANPFAM